MAEKYTDDLETKGRWPAVIKLFALIGVTSGIAEMIGKVSIPIGIGSVIILPMVFAMIFSVLFTPDALGKKFAGLKKICGEEEVTLAGSMMMVILLILGVKLGAAAGPNLPKLVVAGPALICQEFGNLGTILLGLPVAILLGMGREGFGATVSICREDTLGLISERYGISSPEGMGTMGTYMVGNLFGTIFFALLASLGLAMGFHPYALAMACGVGSATMMTASSQALASALPEMAEEILAYAATSNVCSTVDGLYMTLFIGIPLGNFIYGKLTRKRGAVKEMGGTE